MGGSQLSIQISAFTAIGNKPVKDKTPEQKGTETSNNILISMSTILSLRSKNLMTVVQKRRSTIIFEPLANLVTTYLVTASNSMAEVLQEVPFWILVGLTVPFYNSKVIAYVNPHPIYTIETEKCLADVLIVNLEVYKIPPKSVCDTSKPIETKVKQ